MKEINDQVVSIIRTIVPTIVGQVMGWLAIKGILDNDGVITAALIFIITTGATALYYALARLLETYVSTKFGWLLGVAKKPVYKEVK